MHSIKHTRSRVLLFGALVAGLSVAAGPAAAATVYLDGAAGHLWLTGGEAIYRDAQNDLGGNNLVRILDGRQVRLATPTLTGPVGTRIWVIHIPVSDSNTTWNVTARGTNGGTLPGQINNHRICTFHPTGVLAGCGDAVLMNQISSYVVPSLGTAFSQTTLDSRCNGGVCQPSLTLSSIRANN